MAFIQQYYFLFIIAGAWAFPFVYIFFGGPSLSEIHARYINNLPNWLQVPIYIGAGLILLLGMMLAGD